MPDRVFLVHGMGDYSGDWSTSWIAGIRRLYERYPRLSRIPFEQRFKIVPIGYDDIFRLVVGRWQADAASIGPVAAHVQAQRVDQMVGWLRTAGELSENFPWSHCSDVLMYYLFPQVRSAVKVHVASQIANELKDKASDESWSVLAHSLGTAVTHDSLHMLWSGAFEDGQPTGMRAADDKARLVAMIANVSRVLEAEPDVYESFVRPGPASAPDRGCFRFLNARHALDPFTIPKMFNPGQWPDAATFAKRAFLNVRVEHIHEWNVHDFLHYLANPAVHVPLFRSLTFDLAISAKEEKQAMDDFEPWGTLPDEAAVAAKTWLESRAPAMSNEWDVLREVWEWYHEGPGHA